MRRRIALLEWAARNDAVIVEDDYDSEFRFADRPLEPLQSLDREGRVVYVGTFSKTLLPALRVGYAIAPLSLQPALREAKRVTDWAGDAVTQGALASLLADGHLAAHIRRASRAYRDQRDILLESVDRYLGELADLVPSCAGLHVCVMLRDRQADDVALVARALEADVAVEPLSPRYRDEAPRPGLLLGIGRVDAAEVPTAVRLIARAAQH